MKPSIRLMTYSTKKYTWCYRQGFYQIPKNPKIKNTKMMRLRCGKQDKTTDKHAPKRIK
tara:strand:+ start:48 stop:224 length:177 start_codon:yes stop_codon:yes gene_type:complete